MEDWSFLFDIGIPFSFLTVLFALIGLICLYFLVVEKDINKTKRQISITFLVGFVVFVFSSTVIFRPKGQIDNIVLIPLYSYYEAICGNYHLLLENFLNVLLFVPIGILFYLSQKDKNTTIPILFSMGLSITIEISQFIWTKGFCEIDDVIHNTLGCFLGYSLCMIVLNMNLKNS